MKSKQEVCDELNSIINDTAAKTYHLLVDNHVHIGDLNSLVALKAPDNGCTRMPLSAWDMFKRFDALAGLFVKRFKNRLDFTVKVCDISTLHTDDELQAEYDKRKAEEDAAYNSDEYKLYLTLRKKFAHLSNDTIRNNLARGLYHRCSEPAVPVEE